MMLELNKSQKRLPIGGHHFYVESVMFRGETFKEVVDKILDFRKNNNIPAGDPEQEVLRYYEAHWPFMVKPSDKEASTEQSDDYVKWRDWVFWAWKRPPQLFVSQKEGIDRFHICEKCPFFVNKSEFPETQESSEVAKREFILQRGVGHPAISGFCSLHQAGLGPLVFVENPASFSLKKAESQPEECWVK